MSRSESFATGRHSHEYSFDYTGDSMGFHRVTARHTGTGHVVGNLDWGDQTEDGSEYKDGDSNRIRDVYVDIEHRRKGLATAMFEHAHELSKKHGFIPYPEHSPNRTDMGDAWAKSTGHHYPEREQNSDANDTWDF